METKTIATNALKSACRIFMQDLEALPAEAFTKKFGPKVRTVADIVFEVNMVNDHIGMVIRGEKPFDWPEGGWITAPDDFQNKDVVIEAFKNSSERIIATAESFSEEEFTTPFTTEEGETTRFERCRFMGLHLWYHSGQLNFIQTLIGDDEWHWS
ncbi:MAG: DinB family protein [Fimbriimonadaceae bacterium]|nr:MAG: DinB family protein [Fimbriimonadaceae bacterium]